MFQSEITGLRQREARSREQAAHAIDTAVRSAHLGIADIYKAQIAALSARRKVVAD